MCVSFTSREQWISLQQWCFGGAPKPRMEITQKRIAVNMPKISSIFQYKWFVYEVDIFNGHFSLGLDKPMIKIEIMYNPGALEG